MSVFIFADIQIWGVESEKVFISEVLLWCACLNLNLFSVTKKQRFLRLVLRKLNQIVYFGLRP